LEGEGHCGGISVRLPRNPTTQERTDPNVFMDRSDIGSLSIVVGVEKIYPGGWNIMKGR